MVKKAVGRQHWHSTLTYLGFSPYESDKKFTEARSALQDAEEVRSALERGGLIVHAALSRVPTIIQRHLAVDLDGNHVAIVEVSTCAKPACTPMVVPPAEDVVPRPVAG